MREFLAVAGALSDENRVRTLMAVARGELCVCQIIKLLGLAPSTVSKHMAVLRQARLVEARKEGRWIHYRLPGRNAPAHVRDIRQRLRQSLGDDRQIVQDGKRLKAIRKVSKRALCQRYKRLG